MLIADVIRDFHQTALPPAMAPIVVEQPSRSLTAESYEARTTARLRAFQRQVGDYQAAAEKLIGQIRAADRSTDRAIDEADVSGLIDYLERTAEASAKVDARHEKDMARRIRRVETDDPALGLAVRRAATWQSTLAAQLIEEYLDMALQLRAFRSEIAPGEPGPTFDDSEELTRYLEQAVRS